ncbi:MAG TPA: class I SAM-dependent methyltransferase [Propionibacteriaceae bacterium]|nr:class I SAM-dependent methyltransferase [Propionibacteriaceae bacterium]
MTDSATWTERYAAAAMVWDTTPNQFVVEACTNLPPGRALDLGAGEGRNAIWLAGRGWTVTAVDFASIAVGRIASHAALQSVRLDAIVANALNYHPAPDSFDLALLCYLQLPVGQLRKAISNAVSGLDVGGRLVVVAHDESNLPNGVGGPKDPDLLTNADTVAKIATELGLQVVRAELVTREVRTDLGLQQALDYVVEAVHA